jgi:fatty acid desaturase
MITTTTGTFEELRDRVAAAGLLAPRTGYYTAKIVGNLLLTAGCWTAFALLGDSWWQLLVAVALGFSLIQSGFLGHDAGHGQITHSRRATRILGLIHLNLLLGAANGWWTVHHNRHHSDPNNLDRDPDTQRRRHQHWMFFVLLGNEAWRIRRAGFQAARAGALRNPAIELSLVLLHLALFLGIVFTTLPFWLALLFILVSQIVLGLWLGAAFAPNHKGMPTYRGDQKISWLHRQVLTSRNIRSGPLTSFLLGGLNYQIEHHLFPAMPRVNLRRARPIVREYCAEHGIPYREEPAWRSYREVARFLRRVKEERPCAP